MPTKRPTYGTGLCERNGRYYARVIVPKPLRTAIGTTELRTPLGSDRRAALQQLPNAMSDLQAQLDVHRQHAPPPPPFVAREAVARHGLPWKASMQWLFAQDLYRRELARDDLLRAADGLEADRRRSTLD